MEKQTPPVDTQTITLRTNVPVVEIKCPLCVGEMIKRPGKRLCADCGCVIILPEDY